MTRLSRLAGRLWGRGFTRNETDLVEVKRQLSAVRKAPFRYLLRMLLWLDIYMSLLLLRILKRLTGIEVVANYLEHANPQKAIYILRYFGGRVGDGLILKRGLKIDNPVIGSFANLIIGENCHIGKGVLFDLAQQICLQNEVVIGPEVMILTHADVGTRMLQNYFPRKEGGVTLKEGCWIGARSIIMPQVTVGECAVVGAGSVVLKDVPPYTVVAGAPAKVVRIFGGASK